MEKSQVCIYQMWIFLDRSKCLSSIKVVAGMCCALPLPLPCVLPVDTPVGLVLNAVSDFMKF